MWATAIAQAILMWLWSGIWLRLVRQQGAGVDAALSLVWLVLALMVGAAGLLATVWWVLPDSYVSQAWTRVSLERTQQLAALLVLAVGVLGFLSGKREVETAGRLSAAPAGGRQRSGAKRR